MRLLVTFLCLLSLTACSQSYREYKRLKETGISNMPGQNVAYLSDIYGSIDKTETLSTGEITYVWKNSYTYTETDPDLYLPEEQRKLKKAQREQDHKDNTFGDSLVQALFEDSDRPKTITNRCQLVVTTYNGIITKADIGDLGSDDDDACDKFYSRWRDFQRAYPQLFASPAQIPAVPITPPVSQAGTPPVTQPMPVQNSFPSPYH